MNSIEQNIAQIRKQIPQNIDLVCVSKFHHQEAVLQAYNCGERLFGESRVQELLLKYNDLPKDIQWHFIGHLQRNKVRQIVPFVSLIHSVDSVELLDEINRCAEKNNRVVKVLLQVHIAQEEHKFGFSPEELKVFCNSYKAQEYPYVTISGLMGMATFTDDTEQIRREFSSLSRLFSEIQSSGIFCAETFKVLSMGMSDDFPLAIENGSTMVRIGSSIFGLRHK
ncbi:MAG: YggS family pyridoxal phosphate-dependent enzyme [Paludibacteraceae bacterium]